MATANSPTTPRGSNDAHGDCSLTTLSSISSTRSVAKNSNRSREIRSPLLVLEVRVEELSLTGAEMVQQRRAGDVEGGCDFLCGAAPRGLEVVREVRRPKHDALALRQSLVQLVAEFASRRHRPLPFAFGDDVSV